MAPGHATAWACWSSRRLKPFGSGAACAPPRPRCWPNCKRRQPSRPPEPTGDAWCRPRPAACGGLWPEPGNPACADPDRFDTPAHRIQTHAYPACSRLHDCVVISAVALAVTLTMTLAATVARQRLTAPCPPECAPLPGQDGPAVR